MLHFMDLLKDIEEKYLINGKPPYSKKAQTIRKEKFPSLLKTLYTHTYSSDKEISSNLVTGLKKCGIYPLNASKAGHRNFGGPGASQKFKAL